MDVIKHINAIQNTLDGVQVSGRENWDRLLGCVQALDELKEFLMEVPDGGSDRNPD